MAYDPTKPANNSPISSSELRNQFAALKQLTDTIPTREQIEDIIAERAPGKVTGLAFSSPSISDPPTQSEVQLLADTLDSLITMLKAS